MTEMSARETKKNCLINHSMFRNVFSWSTLNCFESNSIYGPFCWSSAGSQFGMPRKLRLLIEKFFRTPCRQNSPTFEASKLIKLFARFQTATLHSYNADLLERNDFCELTNWTGGPVNIFTLAKFVLRVPYHIRSFDSCSVILTWTCRQRLCAPQFTEHSALEPNRMLLIAVLSDHPLEWEYLAVLANSCLFVLERNLCGRSNFDYLKKLGHTVNWIWGGSGESFLETLKRLVDPVGVAWSKHWSSC